MTRREILRFMTAQDLLKDQLDDAGYQLDKSLEGMSDHAMDQKATPTAMTPREQVAHLMEAYTAFNTSCEGGKHEWGSYQPSSMQMPALMEEFRSLRGKAVSKALEGDEARMKEAHAFIVGHDYYHVGQLCQARLAADPQWDPYSIYRP